MLIVIEGIDGSGKQTQTDKIYDRLCAEGKKVKKIRFPDYDSDSSALVKMYLGGEFGSKPDDVSPYVASSFYAVDRIASYLRDWKKDYSEGSIIIADRYTTSNAVHQAGKLDENKKSDYLEWLFDFEYNILGLPKPDIVIFLDIPPRFGTELIRGRGNKITNGPEKDIHEKDAEHMIHSYNNALYIAKKYGWKIVGCVQNEKLRPVDDINDEIYKIITGA